MIDEKTQVVVRAFDATRDTESLRQCVIEQQDSNSRHGFREYAQVLTKSLE